MFKASQTSIKFNSVLFCLAAILAGCTSNTGSLDIDEVQELEIKILNTYEHDNEAFTQGLEFYDDLLIESTGLNGSSSLRLVSPETGKVKQQHELDPKYFAEGITVIDNKVFQITWLTETLIVTPLEPFDPSQAILTNKAYSGEGWGLCYDGIEIIRSDGTDQLIFHEKNSFKELRRLDITLDGTPVNKINELECQGKYVWANIFETNKIVKIDATTGLVTAIADAEALVPSVELGNQDVLNGIAYDSKTGSYWLTGKRWPVIYEVQFLAS